MTSPPTLIPTRAPARVLRRLCFVLLMFAGVLVAVAAPSDATLGYGASYYHPFSNPVWYPLHTAASMGCDMGNPSYGPGPTCRDPLQHTVWSIDLISARRWYSDPRENVYPMGAGILHYGATHQGCGGTASRGNWVYIDHGNGMLSYYGHLGIIAVTDGTYVSPRTRIGTIGNSGYSHCRTVPNMRYLYLAVKHGGTSGVYWNIEHMYVCQGGVKQLWPDNLSNNPSGSTRWSVWNDVPSRMPLQSPDYSRACIHTPAATPSMPVNARMYREGVGWARAFWSHPYVSQSVTRGVVQFQQWHPSIGLWLDLTNRYVTSTSTYSTFYGLSTNCYYRMRVSWANNTGWGRPSAWQEIRSL